MYLIFDTETTGLPKKFNAPVSDVDNWPRCVQIAWQLHDYDGSLIEHNDFLIKPENYDIPYQSEKIHGISTALAKEKGETIEIVLKSFKDALSKTQILVGQNLKFDLNIIGSEFHRLAFNNDWLKIPVLDTCTEKTALLCKCLAEEEVNLNCLHFLNFMNFYFKNLLKKPIMQLLMLKRLQDVFLN